MPSSNADLQRGERSVATWILPLTPTASPSFLICQYDYVCPGVQAHTADRGGQAHTADVGEGTQNVREPTRASAGVKGAVSRHFDSFLKMR
jgi:hypothetical protein